MRLTIERLSLDAHDRAADESADDLDELIAQAHAEGLLLRGGHPAPVVREAVRTTMTTRRLLDLIGEMRPGSFSLGGEWVGAVRDARLGAALASSAEGLVATDPRRALELYSAAVRAGADAAGLAAARAQAAWNAGDLDAAALFVDAAMVVDGAGVADNAGVADAPATPPGPDPRLADIGAATWAARGMLERGGGFYRALPPTTPESAALAAVARIGVGEVLDESPGESGRSTVGGSAPTTVGVSLELLKHGLEASLRPRCADEALADLVRASHLYTAARTSAPIAELPAVIAATVAINLGDIACAHAVIDAAVAGDQGGRWARSRLLLWRSWLAVLRVRPAEARESLRAALALAPRPTPRDDIMVHALQVAIARRWEDAAGLSAAWEAARDSLQNADVDLYLLHPLTEFISAAARLGDDTTMEPHFARALTIVDRLGAPPLWSAHLRWAGIQRGILLNRPDTLGAYAPALVEAAAGSRVSATMAAAGRTWTSVLAGSVDVDAVEAGSQELASIGLAWDAARLAGHGASRASDRKVSARLLARARELHPQDNGRAAPAPSESADQGTPEGSVLSEREIDVARLVVQGKTYAEIGETIFISPRTAEHHIASIRRRLGATSRSDLIAKLRIALEPTARRGADAR
jgi:DNA-binding CsgD family transcriptional regulator